MPIYSQNNTLATYCPLLLLLAVSIVVLLPMAKLQASPIQSDSSSKEQSSPKSNTDKKATLDFGTKGQKRWYIKGAAATTLDNNEAFPRRFGLVGAGLFQFFIHGYSVNLKLNSIYFEQPDDNALGLNLLPFAFRL